MMPLTDGLLSSVGLQNPGIDAVLRRHAPSWARTDVPIVVSVCADTTEDIAALVRTLDGQPEVAAIELNLAGPDRGRAGEPIGLDVEASETATVVARAATELPLIVKLTPAAPDVRSIARAVAAAGADVISAISPVRALALARDGHGPALGTTYGGLSGPAIKAVGLRVVYEIAQVVRIPIIGIGGVTSLKDVIDYLQAGASAVGLATAALADPFLPARLGSELATWCSEHGLADAGALVGQALPRKTDRGSLRTGPFRR
jgi:dihydroorotate dehydrogenase (NAD+) catalytic subunit